MSIHSRSEQNAAFLIDRQNQFKRAAMSAKASGNIELAKKYLRMAKVVTIFTFNIIFHYYVCVSIQLIYLLDTYIPKMSACV